MSGDWGLKRRRMGLMVFEFQGELSRTFDFPYSNDRDEVVGHVWDNGEE